MRGPVRRLAGAALAAAALLLGGCAALPQDVLAPHGTVARMELGLIERSLGIMVGVAAAVYIPLAYILLRYRERPGDGRATGTSEGNTLLEGVWTVLPFVLLVVLALPTFRDTFRLATLPSGPAVDVTVVGHQWWWEFDYPAYGIVTADEMHIPAGAVIDITLRSADVIHAFWVPTLAGKQDAIPGLDLHMWLEADRPGVYPGQCAEFCGLSHALMRFDVVAQSPAAFQSWVSGMQHPVTAPQSSLASEGEVLFAQLGCAGCHTIQGTSAQGKVGPNLTGIGSRRVIVAGALANNPADLGQWLHDPASIIPGTVMPSFPNLNGSQLQAITAYLEGLRV